MGYEKRGCHQESRSCLGFFFTFFVLSHRTVSASRAANSIRRCWNEGEAPARGSLYLGSTAKRKQTEDALFLFVLFYEHPASALFPDEP